MCVCVSKVSERERERKDDILNDIFKDHVDVVVEASKGADELLIPSEEAKANPQDHKRGRRGEGKDHLTEGAALEQAQ